MTEALFPYVVISLAAERTGLTVAAIDAAMATQTTDSEPAALA